MLQPLLRFGLYADLLILVGLAAWSALGQGAISILASRVLSLSAMAWLSGLGVILSAAATLVAVGGMMGQAIHELDISTIKTILLETTIGVASLVRLALLTAAFLSCLFPTPLLIRRIIAICAALALASLAWSGHAAVSEGWFGTFHTLNDVVHLLAVAMWIGAIAGFTAAAWKQGPPDLLASLGEGLRRFATAGTVLVLLVAATGAINLVSIAGWNTLPTLWRGPYGLLLIAKLLLFTGMLIAAGLHRWKLAPALHARIERQATSEKALSALRVSLMVEFLLSIAILALVAWLGMTAPVTD